MGAFIHETANFPTYPVEYNPEWLLALCRQNQLLYIRLGNVIFITQKLPRLRGIFLFAPQFHFGLLSYLADPDLKQRKSQSGNLSIKTKLPV